MLYLTCSCIIYIRIFSGKKKRQNLKIIVKTKRIYFYVTLSFQRQFLILFLWLFFINVQLNKNYFTCKMSPSDSSSSEFSPLETLFAIRCLWTNISDFHYAIPLIWVNWTDFRIPFWLLTLHYNHKTLNTFRNFVYFFNDFSLKCKYSSLQIFNPFTCKGIFRLSRSRKIFDA